MGADLVSDNDPDRHRDSANTPDIDMPHPRPPADDKVENLPEIPPSQPVWWYDQRGKRGKRRRYNGYVKPVGGTEGERLRGELAAIIRDFLNWAKEQQQAESAETDSGEDGGADDKPE